MTGSSSGFPRHFSQRSSHSATTIFLLPAILLYLICQEKLVKGIIAGSIKG